MKRQQKLSLFFTLKKLAVEPEKHEDGLDKDGGEAAGEVSLIMSVVQNYNSLTQTITEMTQFKMPIVGHTCITHFDCLSLQVKNIILSHYFS